MAIVLTSGDDNWTGTAGNDEVDGGAGNDILNGLAGDDIMLGGTGDDTLNGGDGNDRIEPGLGVDTVQGGAGNDTIVFTSNVFASSTLTGSISGGSGIDTIDLRAISSASVSMLSENGSVVPGLLVARQRYTFTGIEQILLGAGDQVISLNTYVASGLEIRGGGGNDTFLGGRDLRLYGEDGNDTFNISGQGGSTPTTGLIHGGSGTNTIQLDPGFTVDLAAGTANSGAANFQIQSIQRVITNADSVVRGDDAANTIQVNALFDSGSARVQFFGRGGNDTLTGSSGADYLEGGAGSDTLNGGAGMDTAAYAGLSRTYSISMTGAAGTVAGGAEGGTDTLSNVEYIQFQDGRLEFDADGFAAQVTRLYDTVLQRAPDQAGLDLWVDLMESGGASLKDVARGFLNSPEFQARTGNLSNADYVEFIYQNALGRASDPGGKAYWVGQLEAGFDRADLLMGFSESVEHRGLTASLVAQGFFNTDDAYQAVALLYDSFAGRQPDPQGLVVWAEAIRSGAQSLGDVADQFAASPEFSGLTAGMTNGQIVEFMYQNTLDRGSDPGGFAYWTGRLDAGMDRGDLLIAFSQSQEHFFLLGPQITNGIDLFG
jgi:Ca2+-binding RTX toxin-like protein